MLNFCPSLRFRRADSACSIEQNRLHVRRGLGSFVIRATAAFAFFLGQAPASLAVTLEVSTGGELLGASGVSVGSALYDVEFLDGTCIELFDGCDANSDFPFPNQAAAQQAMQALLDQVFVNDALGDFDDDPTLTRGCSDVGQRCSTQTPYALQGSGQGQMTVSIAMNNPAPEANTISGWGYQTGITPGNQTVFAVWSAVPEPSTPVLFALGFAWLVRPTRQASD